MNASASIAHRHHGFTTVALLFILVVLAVLGTAIANLSSRSQMGSAMDLENARAYQAARAGLEWGAWQVLRNPAPPSAAPACFATTSFSPGGTLSGFSVTVTCSRTPSSGTVSDGSTTLAFFQITANACNVGSGGSCPSAAAAPSPNYVERQLSATYSR